MSKQEMQARYGRKIQEARKERHMTREELADRVGISTTFCANLECGNKMMSVETLDKLSEVLGGIRLSGSLVTEGSYRGPDKAIFEGMQIF